MKIRTDFVTNSSSSSFIFKGDDKEKLYVDIQKAIKKQLKIPPKDDEDEMGYELLRYWSMFVEGESFSSYKDEDLLEVFDWYKEEVFSEILGVEWSNDHYNNEWEERISSALNLQKEPFPEDKVKKFAAMLILDVYGEYHWHFRDQKTWVFTAEWLREWIWEYLGDYSKAESCIESFYFMHLNTLMEYGKDFEGMSLGDILACFFDAKLMFFYESEIHYLLADILKEYGVCKYACCHMG